MGMVSSYSAFQPMFLVHYGRAKGWNRAGKRCSSLWSITPADWAGGSAALPLGLARQQPVDSHVFCNSIRGPATGGGLEVMYSRLGRSKVFLSEIVADGIRP
jgi:hypothetical protein